MAPLSLTYGHASHVGLRRAENQDAWGISPAGDDGAGQGRLFIVADGMGGHLGGREASRMAVETIAAVFDAGRGGADAVPDRLRRAVAAANDGIYERARHEPALYGMGTTCTALAFDGARAWIAHVGDSRAYRISPDGIRQLTDDHTRVGELVRRKLLTEEEAARHPNRNILHRALGVQPGVEIDVLDVDPLAAGEAFLLCSDGLTGVPTDAIRSVVLAEPPAVACERLVQMANDRGGHDNVTVLVIRAAAGDEGAPLVERDRRYGWGGLLLLMLIATLAVALSI